ncbi:MAG TPA: lipid A deacylase LpxR family protein [Noviherbaspirillum sp.]
MKTPTLRSLAVLAFGILASPALAGAFTDLAAEYRHVMARGQVSHVVDIDNDTLLLNREDGFYSSGMRYSYVSTLRESGKRTTFGWRIGHEMYTPSDIKLPAALVAPPDHPYAAWLYGGFFRDERRMDGSGMRWGVDFGCIGPCAGGEWVQTEFHRVLDQPLPRGWSKQVRNEPGIVLYADYSPFKWSPLKALDVTPGVSARLGNIFTDIGANVMIRAGQVNDMPGESTLHGFLRADMRAVGHNATLEGGYFSDNNPHVVEPRRWVGEAEAGVAWRRGRFGVQAGLVRRSNEIRGLPNSVGAQNFLRLQFSYTP